MPFFYVCLLDEFLEEVYLLLGVLLGEDAEEILPGGRAGRQRSTLQQQLMSKSGNIQVFLYFLCMSSFVDRCVLSFRIPHI